MRWPFAKASTVRRLELQLFDAKTELAETKRLLAQTMIDLHNHKMVLAGRSGVMKVMKEPA